MALKTHSTCKKYLSKIVSRKINKALQIITRETVFRPFVSHLLLFCKIQLDIVQMRNICSSQFRD